MVLMLIGAAFPLAVSAQTQTESNCIISATGKVYVEIHDFSQGRKGKTMWSGTLEEGNEATVPSFGDQILIEWRDLGEENPRTQNRTEFCDGNTIQVPF
jgi:hypothetical protein